MMTNEHLDRGREAFARRAWAAAHAHFVAADRESRLHTEDLQRLATAAYLIGHDSESADAWTRAHHEFLQERRVESAVRCAFWLAFGLLNRGEQARGHAWIARARQMLDDDAACECVERGYLLVPDALRTLFMGDAAAARDMLRKAAEIGQRFGDADLVALARHSCGRVLIRLGRTQEGVELLDQAIVAIDAHEVSPVVVGDVYCSVIEGSLEIFDLRRAREWTTALTEWCGSQPDLVAYGGQCLVRRAEILQLHGVWPDAIDEVRRACDRLLQGSAQPAAGAAFYQRAELHRLQGQFDDAEEAYRQASRYGRKPQPGLALLRLAQGQTDTAATAIRLAVEEATGVETRSRLLPAVIEIMLVARDMAAARAAAEELATIAGRLDAPFLDALVAHARGAILLAESDARAALGSLRRAWTRWREIEVPYEAARARVLIGLAYRTLGDQDAGDMELDAARWIFQELGAHPDVARVETLLEGGARGTPGGLTAREVEVLRLVATGTTNRAIAAQLFISERTVERHVSNIFLKLDVSSRAAATAYAYRHQLV